MNPILEKICKLLKSEDHDAQVAAVKVLSEIKIKDKQLVRSVGEILQKSTDPTFKDIMLELPIKLPAKEYLPYLVPCLSDVSINREKIVHAISSIGPSSIAVLKKRYHKSSEFEKRTILTTKKIIEKNIP